MVREQLPIPYSEKGTPFVLQPGEEVSWTFRSPKDGMLDLMISIPRAPGLDLTDRRIRGGFDLRWTLVDEDGDTTWGETLGSAVAYGQETVSFSVHILSAVRGRQYRFHVVLHDVFDTLVGHEARLVALAPK